MGECGWALPPHPHCHSGRPENRDRRAGFRQPNTVPHDILTRYSEALTTTVQSVVGIARELYDGFVAELKKIAGSSLDHRRAGHLGDPTAWV